MLRQLTAIALVGLALLPFLINRLPTPALIAYGLCLVAYTLLTHTKKQLLLLTIFFILLTAPILLRDYVTFNLNLPPAIFVFFTALLWTGLFVFLVSLLIPERTADTDDHTDP